MALDAPFEIEHAAVPAARARRRCWLAMLCEGGLDGYPEGTSGTPLYPVGAGSVVMKPLDERRRSRAHIAAREDR